MDFFIDIVYFFFGILLVIYDFKIIYDLVVGCVIV